MKKKISYLLAFSMLCLGFAYASMNGIVITTDPVDGDIIVIGDPVVKDEWIREDQPCPDQRREKTRCTKDGLELCTPQYCN